MGSVLRDDSPALGSIQFEGSWTLIKVQSNEEKSTEEVYCDSPPKRARFFGAVNPTTSACRRCPCKRRNHSTGKEHYPDYQVMILRPPIRHEQRPLSFLLARPGKDGAPTSKPSKRLTRLNKLKLLQCVLTPKCSSTSSRKSTLVSV
jgi:hypothetical protein